MLTEIKESLEALGLPVFYGRAGSLSGDDLWNYLVFFRSTLAPSTNKTGITDTYTVAIVQEEYIDDDLVYKVIDSMCSLPGMRLASGDMPYNYTTKPNTQVVIEVLTLDFVCPKKRCSVNGNG